MRSLIILEVEHGKTTDGLTVLLDLARDVHNLVDVDATITDYTVKVDIPPCFRLDK